VRGAYDPLGPIADVCEEFGLWFHIDGAMGGSAVMSETHRNLLEGSERSDSIAWDAHKLLGVPLSCSSILVREKGALFQSLSEQASYLFQNENDEYDLGQISLQCGRRNDALKLWAAWQHHGDSGFGGKVDRIFALTRYAESIIREDPEFDLACPVESITVCFTVRGYDSEGLCERLRRRARAVVGFSIVGGQKVIRLAVVNAAMNEGDIDAFFNELRAACVDATKLPDSESSQTR
jgi:glutamate/tyrosine decarboxylase-like PLP-dependent enzyme